MSQTFTDDLYEQSYVADTTLTNMENNMAALKSMFSGAAAPSNLVGFMPWGNTGKGLERRNAGNTAWLAVLSGDASQKMWVYRNDTCEGWIIDATVTDRVLAVKGGSNAYNVNGGVNAGTWTQPGHTLVESEIPVHTHIANAVGNHTHTDGLLADIASSPGTAAKSGTGAASGSLTTAGAGGHTPTLQNTGGGGSHNHGSTYRPAAAVGTLQYPDL